MAQGLPIAGKVAFATSTTESANQVQATYDYIGPGKLRLYAKGSANTVLCNMFINGQQVVLLLFNKTTPYLELKVRQYNI